ncbi:MAG TPA: squalene--hopene cyclase [Thermoanaerobaculia bacterium]|nr:squalene--hopene cyclase [Thermoanaerobaculia bacterium]
MLNQTQAAASRLRAELDVALSDEAVSTDVRQTRVGERLRRAITAGRERLLSQQKEDGHWCAELEGDSILESEYLMMLLFFGMRDERFEQACAHLRRQQQAHGGWSIYPGGPPEVSPSVKAYFMLKLAGDDPEAAHMRRAREVILRLGGLEACNSFTKLYLSIFGQWSWRDSPAVPPELILLPRWFYLNIYEMSSWSRAIVVPLSILWASKPHRPVEVTLDELRTGVPFVKRGENLRERFWFAFFRLINELIHVAERLGLFRPVRGRALRLCESWVLERLERSDGLAAIFPAIANAAMALSCRGYATDHPAVAGQLAELRRFEILEGGALRLQPCFSPVWDSALSMHALLVAGVDPSAPPLQRAASWLLDHEVRTAGDWAINCPGVEPGGWSFEYANEFYPDCDDTAKILAVFGKIRMVDPAEEARRQRAVIRALAWIRSMQNRDGGWGAFDRDCDREVFTYVPFADHNAMIDPSTADVTARCIEALVAHGAPPEDLAVRRALEYLRAQQESEGCWYGRWGSNYLYGTWLALCALRAAGAVESEPARRGARWLLERQNDDGGWGESLESYSSAEWRGRGASTASQTAWAMMGLLAVTPPEELRSGGPSASALERGVRYLLHAQRVAGDWEDGAWTGTGFPQVFYLRYHDYDLYFPLQALASYSRMLGRLEG